MMPPPGLQIYLRPHVTLTLTFDPLTHKVDRFMPLPRGAPGPVGIKLDSLVFKLLCRQVW